MMIFLTLIVIINIFYSIKLIKSINILLDKESERYEKEEIVRSCCLTIINLCSLNLITFLILYIY